MLLLQLLELSLDLLSVQDQLLIGFAANVKDLFIFALRL